MASSQVNPVSTLNENLVGLATDSVAATGLTKSGLLKRLEAAVRGIASFQDSSGAIIDPVEKREIQYSTPYFAYAASTLIVNGRATDLLPAAVNALSHASADYEKGLSGIPDQHGEFYLFPLAKAYKNLSPLVRNSLARTWLTRLKTPLSDVLEGITWNWRTYAMKGAWALYGIGALSRTSAVNFIESSWTGTQASRFNNTLQQYEDNTSDPDTLAYDYAARANLMYLVTAGYDGASADTIRTTVMNGNTAGLYLIDPTGQVSNTGRSGNHVWNDLVAAVTFERQARVLVNSGYTDTAEKFQRAASLSVLSTDRWQRSDGLYQVTKNQFDPSQKRGYADYSGLTNYNGYMILHLSELVEEWRGGLGEQAMPSETGGYALQTDADYATAVAGAGGVQVNGALRGQTTIANDQYWTQLGVTRISEAGWDSRLGNLSGQDSVSKQAFSLAPAVSRNGTFVRMAELASQYNASFAAETTASELTRVAFRYVPKSTSSGLPTFTQTMTITSDGVLMTISSSQANVAATLPLLVNDGTALSASVSSTLAASAYLTNSSSLNYFVTEAGSSIGDSGTVISGATGNYKPLVASRAGQSTMSVFIYTKKGTDPSAVAVQRSLAVKKYNYSSVLGRVAGTTHVGANGIAGGFGDRVDLDGDGLADVTFDKPVEWVISLRKGQPRFAEADDSVVYFHAGNSYGLRALVARRVR